MLLLNAYLISNSIRKHDKQIRKSCKKMHRENGVNEWETKGKHAKGFWFLFLHWLALLVIIFAAKTIFHLFTRHWCPCLSTLCPLLCIKLATHPTHTPPPIMGLALARVKNFICTRYCHAYGRIGCPNKVWKVERSTGWGIRGPGSGSTGAPHWPPYLTPVEHENAI